MEPQLLGRYIVGLWQYYSNYFLNMNQFLNFS